MDATPVGYVYVCGSMLSVCVFSQNGNTKQDELAQWFHIRWHECITFLEAASTQQWFYRCDHRVPTCYTDADEFAAYTDTVDNIV